MDSSSSLRRVLRDLLRPPVPDVIEEGIPIDGGVEAPLVVVALGGNAIQHPDGDDSVAGDFSRTAETARDLAAFALSGPRRLVITHGNGPQVGNHLLRSEIARNVGGLPELPLDVCVADTQGGMGYMLQQCLGRAFGEAGTDVVVAALVTQVVVNEDDPAFGAPSKPVGEMVADEDVASLEERGWVLQRDEKRGGWRRVVASPDPVEIVEAAAIQALVTAGVVVVAAGGGGVPVVSTGSGLRGKAAVVDKDLASALLAADLGADALVILTDVEHVSRSYGTPDEESIAELTVDEADRLVAAGEFGEGSMKPKVEAMSRFVRRTGRPGVIASIEDASRALDGIGTRFIL